MNQKTRRTSLFLPETQLERLAKLSAETGAPQAELIRRAIDMYLSSKGCDNDEVAGFSRDAFREPDSSQKT